MAARQVLDRLMQLDAIVLHPELMWLGTDEEKVAFFGLMAPSLPRERLPHITVGKGASQRVRFFPEDQPIAVTSTGRVVFTYVVSAGYLEEFRAFVQRHADLLRALPGWTLKVLVPRPLADAMASFVEAARYELTSTLRAETLAELKWYFNKLRSTSNPRALSFEDEDFWSDQAAFSAPRFQQLYRRWLTDGDSIFESVSSPVITEALERGTGRIEAHVLLLSYRHLSPWPTSSIHSTRGLRGETHAPHGLNPRRRRRPRFSTTTSAANATSSWRLHASVDQRLAGRGRRIDGAAFCAAPDRGSDCDQ